MIKNDFTNEEINRLGDRLRKDEETIEDSELLNKFRASFDESFKNVIQKLRKIIDNEDKCILNDRQTKTHQSIKDKLKRIPKMNLSRMQDIRGCRIVVEGGNIQAESILKEIKSIFEKPNIKIRNDNETGYRAIHIIVKEDGHPVEIQLRTVLQDLWANWCEKYSANDLDLKYGTREAKIKHRFIYMSDIIFEFEKKKEEFLINFNNKKNKRLILFPSGTSKKFTNGLKEFEIIEDMIKKTLKAE